MPRKFFPRPLVRLKAALVLAVLRRLRQPTQRSGLLLIASGGLGDNVLLSRVLPVFQSLAQPNERVLLLIRSDAAAVSFLFPPSIEVRTYHWRRFQRSLFYRWRLSYGLHRLGLRLVVSTDYDRHPFVDDHLVAATGAESLAEEARPSKKFARDVEANQRFFTRLLKPGHAPLHRYMRLVRLAGWIKGAEVPVPPLTAGRRARPAPGLVVLHPCAGDTRKNVSPQIFRAVMRALPDNARIVVSAAPGDLDRCPEYRVLLDDPRAVLDQSGLPEKFHGLLRKAQAVVSADTMLAHLAIVAGARTLCIASAAYVGWAIPYDPRMSAPHARFLVLPVDCAGCLGACSFPLEKGRFPCVARHAEDQVVAELKALVRDLPLCA